MKTSVTRILLLVWLFTISLVFTSHAGILITYPKFRATNDSGTALTGGKLYTYASGTTTVKATYSDKALTTANANPVILDRRGEASIYGSGSYKLVLKDTNNNTIWTVDNFDLTFEGKNIYYPSSSEPDQGAVSTGASMKDIVTALGSSKQATIKLLHDGSGNRTAYTLATSLVIPSNITVEGEAGAYIAKSGAPTLTINGPFLGWTNCFDTGLSVAGLKDVVRIEWWGGKGDDTTDNTSAFTTAIASGVSPNIQLLAGIYRHTGISSSSTPVTIRGVGEHHTTLRNTSGAGLGIFLASGFSQISDLTISNGSGTGSAMRVEGEYTVASRLIIMDVGGTTSYALDVSGASGAIFEDIVFSDGNPGNLNVHSTGSANYLEFRHIGGGTVTTLAGASINSCVGCNFYGATFEHGPLGAINIAGSQGTTFHGYGTEISSSPAITAGNAVVHISNSNSISFLGGRIQETACDFPFFKISGNSAGVVIDGMFLKRTGAGTSRLFWLADNNKNLTIANITTDIAATTVGIDSSGSQVQMRVDNWYDSNASLTHVVDAGSLTMSNINSGTVAVTPRAGMSFTNISGGITGLTSTYATNVVGVSGYEALFVSDASATLAGASKDISVNVPTGAVIVGVSLNIDTAITFAGGGATWSAALSGGATDAIVTGTASVAQNSKVNKGLSALATATTIITVTPNAGTFATGKIRALVRYRIPTNAPDA
jgi:hypothetical protein